MLEFLFFFSLFFLIAVLFYKQRRKDLQILQMEYSQLEDQFTELLEEQQPLVIRGVQPPKGLTQEGLRKIPRLSNFSVGGQPLAEVLKTPSMLYSAAGLPTINQLGREQLATELSIPVWANRLWRDPLNASVWFGSTLGTLKAEVVLGGMGLFRTAAYTTLFFPTEDTYRVSIVARDAEDFLPPQWEYRYIHTFTPNDTPLISELKYLDILVRPGTALCIPRHTIISIEPTREAAPFSSGLFLEFHMPVSLLAKSFS